MREIEGIEEALDVLRPHWDEIEEDFNRANNQYLALAAIDHEAVGRVLRAHLIVENFLNKYLIETFGFEDLNSIRLSFAQKAAMIPTARVSSAWVRPGILQLNTVRNKYGHRLDHNVEFEHISSIMEVLSVARSEQQFATPIEAIEAFAPVACAFLSVPPRHLSQAFAEAFRNVRINVPAQDQ